MSSLLKENKIIAHQKDFNVYLPELVADVPDLYDHALLLLAAVHILTLDQEP